MSSAEPPYFIGEPRPDYFECHGVQWRVGTKPLHLELACFREKMAKRMDWSLGGVSPAWHFKRIAMALWPENSDNHHAAFIWHRWADQMLQAACHNQYLGVAGPGGAGKSEFYAIWLIVNFLCDPANTVCLITSTTVGVSRKKGWGKIVEYWTPCEKMGMPGKLVDSLHIIRYIDDEGVAIKGDMAGIALITGERRKEKEAVGKMIGIHQERIIFCADDLTELSEAITEAAFFNLSRGCQHFQFISIGNPHSFYDPFGKFITPIRGWDSINVESEEWETARGIAIHFDATKNPRIVDGDERLTWMDSREALEKEIEVHGGNSASFWRMVRGFFCPTGISELIYTEVEIINCHADEPAIWRDEILTKVSFLDPSFTSYGDRTVAYFGTFGHNRQGLKTLQYDDYVIFHEDVTDKETTRSQQLIKWWKALCDMRGVNPRNAGFDSTGAGGPLGDLIDIMFSKEILRINFSGGPTDKPVSAFDSTLCSERYANRVSEIWYSAKQAMRSGQIKGLGAETIREMTTRKKQDEKGLQLRIRIESKLEMKNHTDQSPDIADAAMGLCELCCERLGFSSAVGIRRQFPQQHTKPFKALFRKRDIFAEQRAHLQKMQSSLRL